MTHSLRRAVLMGYAAAVVACGSMITSVSTVKSPPESTRHVVVVKTRNALVDEVLASFLKQIEDRVTVITLSSGDSARAVHTVLTELQPQLIFALGEQAAVACRGVKNTPLLFAMVPDYARLGLGERSNTLGISIVSRVGMDFYQFKMVYPAMKRVLIIYTPESSDSLLEQARRELSVLGITAVGVPARNLAQVRRAYEENVRRIDAIWMHADRVLMNRPAWDFLRKAARADRVAIVSSVSDTFAEEGALAAVSLDFGAIGSQAANMAIAALDGSSSPQDLGVRPPIGGFLAVNLGVAEEIGIAVPEQSYPFINRLITVDREKRALNVP